MRPTIAEQPGAVIAGRYKVEQLLGRGGMAIVYRVHDRHQDRRIALKRCFAQDIGKLARYGLLLEREYHTLAQLAHPHIIDVYDYGVEREVPYYTMELLDGIDLAQIERMPWRSACVIMHDVASALALLHARGLVHRDVSTRNVSWAENRPTKLIDFGAMASMGVSKDAVGTPPFMAPEVLQLQALDGRADIFSLGALGYRLLTGRHAFPARRFSELRDAWRSKPIAPKMLAPDVPAELSALVLRMLRLERSSRVQTAAEIIEQLRPLAGLAREDSAEISRAYLTAPLFVGRDTALLAARRQMLSLVRGEGGLLFVRGAAGSGRSRMLDACVLEAKLVGAGVARADARDASLGEWGVARALGRQLIASAPKQAAEAARLSRSVLGHLFEELQPQEPSTTTGFSPDRSLLLRELRDFVLALCASQRLVLVVDDLERSDEASLAWLTALAHKSERHAILIAVATADEAMQVIPAALRMLCDASNTVELADLAPAQTEALIRSVFGEVSNVSACAARIHRLSQGNPRATMELAQHLVDTGRARYEAGSWNLPDALDESDLPTSLSDSLLARLRQLSEGARELADALALCAADLVLISQYAALTGGRDHKQLFRALDELIARRIVSTDGERAFFAQRGFIAVLQEHMAPARRQQLHTRIAALLSTQGGDLFQRAYHLFEAGVDGEALDLLARVDLSAQLAPAALLRTAIERAQRLNAPAKLLQRLRMGLLISAPYSLEYETFRDVAPLVLARLVRDSGLERYRQLEGLAEAERLTQAMARVQAEYLAMPEHERVYAPYEAIRELARLSGAILSMAIPIFDPQPLQELPSLAPFFPLSPSLEVISDFIAAGKEWLAGRPHNTARQVLALLRRIDEPDNGGFDEAQHERVLLGLHGLIGLHDAMYGLESAEQHAAIMERSRELRVNAWGIRGIFKLAIGNTQEADQCFRRAELLQVQHGLKERYVDSTTGIEVMLRFRLGDLLGVKSHLPALAHLARRFPAWRAVELGGRCMYHQLQGDRESALEHVLAALKLATPGLHPFYGPLAMLHIECLDGLGRTCEAAAKAREYIATAREHDLLFTGVPELASLALANAGEHEEAVRLLEPVIEDAKQRGRRGLAIGLIYRVRARIAIAANDAQAFRTYADRCAEAYAQSENPALGAQLTALFDKAREHGLAPNELATTISRSLQPPAQQDELDTLHSRFVECLDRADRARCALSLLLQNALGSRGYLYGMGAERAVSLLAALPEGSVESGLQAWVERRALAWSKRAALLAEADDAPTTKAVSAEASEEHTITDSESMTVSGAASPDEATSQSYLDADGRSLEALLLHHGYGPDKRLVAVLAIETPPGQHAYLPRSLADAIAAELLEYGDATGWSATRA